jgi:hypothetical protein
MGLGGSRADQTHLRRDDPTSFAHAWEGGFKITACRAYRVSVPGQEWLVYIHWIGSNDIASSSPTISRVQREWTLAEWGRTDIHLEGLGEEARCQWKGASLGKCRGRRKLGMHHPNDHVMISNRETVCVLPQNRSSRRWRWPRSSQTH